MDKNTKILAGTTGAGAIAVGCVAKQQSNILRNQLNNLILYKNVDSYTTSRIEANMDKIHSSLKQSKWKEAFTKVAEKARNDYSKYVATTKKATKCKNLAILLSAGLAIVTAITLIAGKVKEKKLKTLNSL